MMNTVKHWTLTLIVVALLAASLACGGSEKATETPATATAAPAKPTATPEPTAPPVTVMLGEVQRNEEGGFAFRVAPDYELTTFGGMATMLAPGADPDIGPVLLLIGGETLETNNEQLFADLKAETPMTVSEPEAIEVQGIPGLAADIEGDNNGKAMRGRIAIVMVTPTQQFTLLVGAPAAQWDETAPYFDAVLGSVEFFTPVAPEPISSLPSGWYAYVNSNVLRDVTIHDDIIYAATLGGLVARDLDGNPAGRYTPLDGLGHISTHAIVACEMFGKEQIVVGTLEGLSLFDPATGQWDNTPIAPEDSYIYQNKIDRLYCDREQRWLLIGYSGLGVMDIDNGDFVRFTDKEGLSWNGISDIAVNGSEIWVASGYNGISKISGDNVTIYNTAAGMPDERVSALAFGPGGVLWAGGSKGLMKFSSGQWTLYEGMSAISEIEIAADGSVWVATAPFGVGKLARFDPKTSQYVTTYQDMGQDAILTLTLDPQGRAIYGTGKGLYAYDEASNSATPYLTASEQLKTNFVDDFAAAPDGKLWVGTDGGIQVLNPDAPGEPWVTYTKADTPGLGGSWAKEIAIAPDGTTWVAIMNGAASRYSDGAWTNFEDIYSYENVAVDAQGRAWFGDDSKGIIVLNNAGSPAMQLTTAEGLPSDRVQDLLVDGETIWIALDIGLAKYANGQAELVLDKNALPHVYLRSLALESSGTLLVGGSLSIVRYDGSQVKMVYDFEEAGVYDWLNMLTVEKNGRIWAGTAKGVWYTDDGAQWTHLTTADGLLTNFISALHVDQYGAVWIGGGGSNFDGGGILHIVP